MLYTGIIILILLVWYPTEPAGRTCRFHGRLARAMRPTDNDDAMRALQPDDVISVYTATRARTRGTYNQVNVYMFRSKTTDTDAETETTTNDRDDLPQNIITIITSYTLKRLKNSNNTFLRRRSRPPHIAVFQSKI